MQILIQSKREDLSSHINNIKAISEKENNKIIKKYVEKYLEFINEKNNKNKSASKNIYLIIKNNFANLEENIFQELNEKYFKIKECLARCGNIVLQYDTKQEVEKIINSFLNVRKELKII